MAYATVHGARVRYEISGSGTPLILTPGGRFGMDYPGVRPLAERLAEHHTVILWDRPNAGGSQVKFSGETECHMYADDMAELLRTLDVGPTVLAGGSAGSRVSVLMARWHPELTAKLVCWGTSGGVFGTMFLAMQYVLPYMAVARWGGMTEVAKMPQFAENIAADPSNRTRLEEIDTAEFLAVMDRWLTAYIPRDDHPLPGVHESELEAIDTPTLIFRNGREDIYHPEEVTHRMVELIPGSQLVDPPWGEDEWDRVKKLQMQGKKNLFDDWRLLAPQILAFTAP